LLRGVFLNAQQHTGGNSLTIWLNEDLQDVTRIMTKNMEDLLWRGDSLDRMSHMSSRGRVGQLGCYVESF
jgi:hypothetical protein